MLYRFTHQRLLCYQRLARFDPVCDPAVQLAAAVVDLVAVPAAVVHGVADCVPSEPVTE